MLPFGVSFLLLFFLAMILFLVGYIFGRNECAAEIENKVKAEVKTEANAKRKQEEKRRKKEAAKAKAEAEKKAKAENCVNLSLGYRKKLNKTVSNSNKAKA